MKQLIKYFIFLLSIVLILSACSSSDKEQLGGDIDDTLSPDALDKLQHIHPTKPIRIPDTMAILMRPAILENPSDTTENNECEIKMRNEELSVISNL